MGEKAPPSGRLFQEDLLEQPFWMLVACQLVNLTSWREASPVLEAMRARWPGPSQIAVADGVELEQLLRPLGLFRRRALTLRGMSAAWLDRVPRTRLDVLKLPGCGRYASDSWAVFVEGDNDVEVTDGKLLWYLRRRDRRRQRDALSDHHQSGPNAGDSHHP